MFSFVKMEGIGNDYVYVDARKAAPKGLSKLARAISDRHFGVGSDGLILIRTSRIKGVKHRMQMFNSDGSESEMCGNGLRCVAKYLYDRNLERKEEFSIETGAGVLHVKVTPTKGKHVAAKVQVNMGEPRLLRSQIPMAGEPEGMVVGLPLHVGGHEFAITCVSMGNPHCVIFLPEPPSKELVHGIGPLIENHEWFPRRTNVEFVYRESERVLHQRTWERGAGETLACGTGASAVCVAANLNGLAGRKVKIKLLGGDLEMHWNEKDTCVYKTGPAREVFSGVWPA
ncbi:MAG: diaminopimelate epimerase [Planctomycetes bacterium]|nr:diaminopimelate epimerase [Planctomycetota bacterium]